MQSGEILPTLRAGVIEQVNRTADASLLDLIYRILVAEREAKEAEKIRDHLP